MSYRMFYAKKKKDPQCVAQKFNYDLLNFNILDYSQVTEEELDNLWRASPPLSPEDISPLMYAPPVGNEILEDEDWSDVFPVQNTSSSKVSET